MRHQNKFLLSSITLAVLTLTNQAYAEEQAAKPAKDSVEQETQQIVVTGSSQSKGLRKIDAAYSITTATEEQIKEAAPSSTADLMKIVPGAFAESTGGTAGANIEVRGFPSGGDAPFVTIQMMGAPLFPPPTLSFLENSSLFRIDDMIDHVEVLRGGPSPIFSNGQPGMTMNFLLKKGADTPEGTLRFTTGTGNQRRFDGYYSGKIADGWYGSIGGFYRTTNGVRNAGFPSDEGTQLTGVLTRKLDQGELTMYARTTNDRNAFFTGVPLVAAATAGTNPSAFPGFNPLTGTPASNALRNVTLEVSPGVKLQKDLADGRGLHANVFGIDFSQKINGWNISDKMNYLSGDAPTLALFNQGTPQKMSDYLASAATTYGSPGTATYAGTTTAVDPNQQVMQYGVWSVEKNLKSFTNELRFSKELVKDHTITAGLYFANYSSHDLWYLGNSTLMTATSNATPISVKLANGTIVANDAGRDGPTFYAVNANYNGRNTAVFLADDWKVNDRVRVDAGIRHETQHINGSISDRGTGDADNNPLTVYNNNTSMNLASTTGLTRDDNATSYTVGGNYAFTKNFSVFARANSGHGLPTFEDLRNNGTQANVNNRSLVPLVDVKQYEVGLKTVGDLYSAYLTFFHNDFSGLPNQQFINGVNVVSVGGSHGDGLEFELALRPFRNFQVALTGDYQKSKYKDFVASGINGNEVQRQPKLQFRLTPSYRIPMGDNEAKLFATYTYVGDRFSDLQNQQVLPKYHTFDAGVNVALGDKLELRVQGTNLTNEFGLTEGNPRVVGSGSDIYFARPIFGRAFEASLTYRF